MLARMVRDFVSQVRQLRGRRLADVLQAPCLLDVLEHAVESWQSKDDGHVECAVVALDQRHCPARHAGALDPCLKRRVDVFTPVTGAGPRSFGRAI